MGFPDDFISEMSSKGVTVAAEALPSGLGDLKSAIDTVLGWFDGLDEATKAGLNAATQGQAYAAQALVAAGAAGADALAGLLAAFDSAEGTVEDHLKAAKDAAEASSDAPDES